MIRLPSFFIAISISIVAVYISMPLNAQTNTANLSPEQIKEERAYATGIQALLWGRPLVEYATSTKVAVVALRVFVNGSGDDGTYHLPAVKKAN
jgi:hypothetical protein